MQLPKTFSELPSWDELEPKNHYWVYPKGSEEEGLGMTRYLTADHVKKSAQSEIQTGERISIGLPFSELNVPFYNRPQFKLDIHYATYPVSIDDHLEFNPQASSQWDGLRHHSQPGEYSVANPDDDHKRLWYGGTSPKEIFEQGNARIGMQYWARKGIVGRGILLDYADWAAKHGVKYSCFESHAVRLEELKQIIKEYNITVREGDILFVRVGLHQEYKQLTTAERFKAAENSFVSAGVEQSPQVLKWIWNNHFVAVASDAPAFEVSPFVDPEHNFHEWGLAGWGVPIGELFDLDQLSKMCQELNRYSFFVSSVPFNTTGGVSSSPNAVAIF